MLSVKHCQWGAHRAQPRSIERPCRPYRFLIHGTKHTHVWSTAVLPALVREVWMQMRDFLLQSELETQSPLTNAPYRKDERPSLILWPHSVSFALCSGRSRGERTLIGRSPHGKHACGRNSRFITRASRMSVDSVVEDKC